MNPNIANLDPKFQVPAFKSCDATNNRLRSSKLKEIFRLGPVKDQIVNILTFESHTLSIVTSQLCYCGTKAAIDNTEMD